MSEILKNTASQSVFVTVIDSSTGGGKTSGVSFTYTAAGGSQTALTNTPTHKGNGQYEVVLSQAETNVDCFSVGWYGSGVVPNCVTILTTTKRLRDLQDLAAGSAMTLTEAGVLAIWNQLLTAITTAGSIGKLIKDYLDAAITSRSSHDAAAVVTAMASGSIASVTGAVGSVTGNVGGNVAGSVASVIAGVTLADDAITSAKFDESTAFPIKSADAGATLIARVGAQMDLVNSPNATAIAAIKTAMEAAGSHLASILADTAELQTDWANGGRLDLLIDAIKAITDQINFTGTDVNANASVALTEGDIASIASGVAAAIKLTTGWTAGGTLTYAEVVKIIAAAVAGKVIDKAGVAGTVQHLDVEDATTAIFENIPSNTTSPYRDPTIL